MPSNTTLSTEDARIRKHLDTLAQALREKNITALMAHYAPDVVVFDLMPLQTRGADAYRKNFEAWFASVQGPIDYEMRDLSIVVRDDVAVCRYLGHVKSTRKTGEKNDYRVRVTSDFQKLNGQWMVIHEHVSVPFTSGETLQAALLQR